MGFSLLLSRSLCRNATFLSIAPDTPIASFSSITTLTRSTPPLASPRFTPSLTVSRAGYLTDKHACSTSSTVKQDIPRSFFLFEVLGAS